MTSTLSRWRPVVAVALVACGLGACSPASEPGSQQSLPQFTADSSSQATPAASASPTTGGSSGASTVVTAEELSRPDIEFTVTSVPADLTPEEAEVVRDVAYVEEVTWNAGREMSGLEEVEPLLVGQQMENYTNYYRAMEAAGERHSGSYSIDITSVTVESDIGTATADFCSDMTNISQLSADNQDGRPAERKKRVMVSNEMARTDSGWVVTDAEEVGPCR